MIDSDRHPPFSNTSLFDVRHSHTAFKHNNYYRLCGEIRQTFFCQIGFFADSPNFNPSKLSSFTVLHALKLPAKCFLLIIKLLGTHVMALCSA